MSILTALVLVVAGQPAARSDASEASKGTSTHAESRDERLREVITDWNEAVFAIAIAEDRLLTLKGLRTACLMHLAIHDALNSIEPRFERFAYEGPAGHADPVAAVVHAAFGVVSGQYPDQAERLEGKTALQPASIPDSPARSAGAELGRSCAASVMERRDGDAWDTQAEYAWHPMGPGVYAEFNEHSGTPEGFIFGAGWARAKPFVLTRPDQFRSPPPPAVSS
ncbi:MAG: hypothetical protein HKN20_01780, partial [Gemmatimonadetes bacterium]|nr:hypothetical protein [Gemmatimonadota bacterium]